MFTPRYIKHSKLLLRHAEKYLRYKRDRLSTEAREQLVGEITRLRDALKKRDHERIKADAETLDASMHKLMPVTWESHWRENVEVIFVAIVVAVGIRSYFLQPFKIPTGSMQPTLNGIIGHPQMETAPNFLQQIVEYVVLGRNYINVVSRENDQVLQMQPQKFFFFFALTRVICQHQNFRIYAPVDTLKHDFGVFPGREYKRGEVIARGAIDTGDQVFVDKCSYNFIKPHRGDVFVFRTDNIPGIPGDPETGQPFYIKRLAGLPGDTLRISPPYLYINGKLPEEFGFKRVIAARDGYRGYGLGSGYGAGSGYLLDSNSTFTVPEHGYVALGDNSYNSLDSRYWGSVPEANLVGRGLLVYWPFNRHWGLIR